MKSKNKQQRPRRIALLLLIAVIAFTCIIAASILVARQIERQRFLSLDTHIGKVAETLNSVDPSIKWTKQRGCVGFGTFNEQPHCKVSVSAKTTVNRPDDFIKSYKQYKQILTNNNFQLQFEDPENNNSAPNILMIMRLDTTLLDNTSGISCTFNGLLTDEQQTQAIGSKIVDASASAKFAITCEANAQDHWFTRTDFNLKKPPAVF